MKKRPAKSAETSNIPKTLLNSDAKSLTILVVDDSETSRKITMKLLTMCGHRCQEAKDGYDALHTISSMCGGKCCKMGEAKAAVDAVLMDHHMPLMSGNSKHRPPSLLSPTIYNSSERQYIALTLAQSVYLLECLH